MVSPDPGMSYPVEAEGVLRAICDHLVPASGAAPAAWEGGVGRYLRERWHDDLVWAHAPVASLLAAVGGAAADVEDLAATLRTIDANPQTAGLVAAILRLVREGYYGGNRENPPGGWTALGYRPWPEGVDPRPDPVIPSIARAGLRAHYDAIVVGAGPGGGVAARLLAESGARVLLVERAADLGNLELAGDHLRGKRMAVYRPTAGAGAGHPRVVEEPDGSTWTADGDGGGDAYGLNAMTLGGGTRLWQGMAWRFVAEDFRMASVYGRPAGSTLTDWPISDGELAGSYSWAERELGVSGETGHLTDRLPGHPGYPMPALPEDATRILLGRAAESRGWGSGPIPFAINSVPRDGRPGCAACHQCMGHACPVNAKNGAHNTFVPTAVATGNCDLLYEAEAIRIHHDGGTASAVELGLGADGERVVVGCDLVVVAAGAVDTPRLVINSGLGNEQAGRHLHAHVVSLQVALTEAELPTFRGPGHSVATWEFLHDASGAIGGGVLFDAFAPYPLQLMDWADALGAPRWGAERSAWLERAVDHVVGVMSIGQEVPDENSRVTTDSGVLDRFGMPAARIVRATHPTTVANLEYLRERGRDWLAAAGSLDAVEMFAPRPGAQIPTTRARRSPASEHSAGTMRMGDDPATSATDRYGRLHGATNVVVCDASLHPTNGSVNPTLTIVANAHRLVSELVSARAR